jgi:hypothetical protein
LVGAAINSPGVAHKAHGDNGRFSAGSPYWLLLMYAVMAVLLWGGTPRLMILALGLPFIQIGVCMLTALVVAFLPCFQPQEAYLRSVGRITLGTILGGMIGLGIMIVLLLLMGLAARA